MVRQSRIKYLNEVLGPPVGYGALGHGPVALEAADAAALDSSELTSCEDAGFVGELLDELAPDSALASLSGFEPGDDPLDTAVGYPEPEILTLFEVVGSEFVSEEPLAERSLESATDRRQDELAAMPLSAAVDEQCVTAGVVYDSREADAADPHGLPPYVSI